jgi:hypothetical protein
MLKDVSFRTAELEKKRCENLCWWNDLGCWFWMMNSGWMSDRLPFYITRSDVLDCSLHDTRTRIPKPRVSRTAKLESLLI